MASDIPAVPGWDDARCQACGAEVTGLAGRLMHAEPWCESWTYHAAVGDALPVRWLKEIRND